MSENKTISEMTITVVEPSTTQWHIIKKHMEELGITRLDHFSEGKAALADIKKYPPDLVISAMHLPDITGTDLVQAIRNDSEIESVPFMLISSEESDYYLEPLKQAGVVAILPKPFGAHELKSALFSTLEFIAPNPEDVIGDIDIEDLRVLVVDDSLTARKHIIRVLKNLGIEEISEAINGKEAVAIMEGAIFDLMVTDYNMPEMDGQELTRYVREKSDQQAMPILMVTSESSTSQLAGVRQSGVSALCDKPFEPLEVKQLIRKILS